MTKEELIEEYIKWSGHPYKDLAYAFHTDLIAFAKHCIGEKKHYMRCNRCGDFFDMRNFTRVAAHEVCERLEPFKQGEKI